MAYESQDCNLKNFGIIFRSTIEQITFLLNSADKLVCYVRRMFIDTNSAFDELNGLENHIYI